MTLTDPAPVKRRWVQPALTRLSAAASEGGPNPQAQEGQFAKGGS